MKDVVWVLEKYIRVFGGCVGGVVIVFVSLGGNVVFMGKFGGDDFG